MPFFFFFARQGKTKHHQAEFQLFYIAVSFARSALLDLLAAAATLLLKVQLQDQVSNFFSFVSDQLTREPILQMQWLFKINYGILVREKGVFMEWIS